MSPEASSRAESGIDELSKAEAGQRLLEGRVNQRGDILLQGDSVKQATCVFRGNVQAFPGSANTYDSLGEAYLAAGYTSLSVENYKKSLELDPENENAREVLKRIQRQ